MLLLWKQVRVTDLPTSAVLCLLVLAWTLMETSAEELHSKCDFVCIDEDAECQILKQEVLHNAENSSLQNVILQFLSTGDLKMGSLALQVIEEYRIRRNQPAKEDKIDDPAVNNTNIDFEWFLCQQKLLVYLLTLGKNQLVLKEIKSNLTYLYKAYEETHHYPSSTYALAKTSEKYVNVLNSDINVIESLKSSYNTTGLLIYPWISELLSSSREKEHLIVELNMIKKELSTFVKTVDVMHDYVDPAVYASIFVLGMVLNGTMIIIYARHKEVRTPPNIMLFNLAVTDILNLIINVLFAPMFKSGRFAVAKSTCRIFLTVRHMAISVSALSIVALSWQRYMAVANAFQIVSDFAVFIYILVVWLIALGDGLLNALILDDPCYTELYLDKNSKILDMNNFLLYCVFLPLAMVVISILTALKLNNSAKAIPGAHANRKAEVARYRSARIVITLAIVFLISNIPISLRYVLYTWFSASPNDPVHIVLMDSIFLFLLFSNSWFNPIALYMASKLFRGYFQHYLFCHFLRQGRVQMLLQTTKSTTDETGAVELNTKM